MKQSTWDLNDLEIIGYGDVLPHSMLPAIVPPVFRSISNPAVVLVPPYALHFDTVAGATIISAEEAGHLGASEELTLFLDPPIQSQPGHSLWLRRDGTREYQPFYDVRHELDRQSADAVGRATKALSAGDLAAAEAAASEAILCNDRRADAFAIKAAIRRIKNNPVGEELMADLARTLCNPEAFEAQVARFTNTATKKPLPGRAANLPSPLSGITQFSARAA